MIDIPGGKGTITLPRAAVAEVAISQGNQSRWTRVPGVLPFIAPSVVFATISPPPGPHHNAFRNQRIILSIAAALPVFRLLARAPNERWEPMYRWLEGR